MDKFKGRLGRVLQEFTQKISEGRFFITVTEKDILRSNDWNLKVDKFRPELRLSNSWKNFPGGVLV